jgi:hypothetical protein
MMRLFIDKYSRCQMPNASAKDVEELLYCIQGSAMPAFRGVIDTDNRLQCAAGCGQVLIDNYVEDCYVSVGIQCFKCGQITRTPCLPLGEVFATPTVSLGSKGRYLLGSTVSVPPGVVLTCDQEIEREIAATAPRVCSTGFTISEDGIKRLVSVYDEIIGGKFQQQKTIVERLSLASVKTFPFTWAISHLEKCLRSGIVDIRYANTLTALMWLNMFSHVVETWQHHPRFNLVAKDLGKPKSFLHTSAQLITAAYLYHAGNRVGLSLEDNQGVPNPDLYIRSAPHGKVFLEVKAPEALQWGDSVDVSEGTIQKAVKDCIKRSSYQINRAHRGVLVISSSLLSNSFPALIEKCARQTLKLKGRDHRGLAAVACLSPSNVAIDGPSGDMRFACEFSFGVAINEHFDGDNPISTHRGTHE